MPSASGDQKMGLLFGLVFVFSGPCLQDVGRTVPHVDAGRL